MCCKDINGCLFPDKLKETPEECSPEQIKDCHGEEADHPCVEKKKEE